MNAQKQTKSYWQPDFVLTEDNYRSARWHQVFLHPRKWLLHFREANGKKNETFDVLVTSEKKEMQAEKKFSVSPFLSFRESAKSWLQTGSFEEAAQFPGGQTTCSFELKLHYPSGQQWELQITDSMEIKASTQVLNRTTRLFSEILWRTTLKALPRILLLRCDLCCCTELSSLLVVDDLSLESEPSPLGTLKTKQTRRNSYN